MKRLAVLTALLGLAVSNTVLAAEANEPAFCKSMCSQEQRECRAKAVETLGDEASAQSRLPEKNTMARTAQEQIRGLGARAMDSAGYENRRIDRRAACDTQYQRCTRACTPVMK